MHDLDLLVPSALVDPDIAPELLRDPAMPHLARIVAHAGRTTVFDLPPHAPLTTWQSWLFDGRGEQGGVDVNIAELWAAACGVAPAAADRYLVEPAHFKVANDHLRLDDPCDLALTLPEAHALAASVEPVLAEAGWRLAPIEPATLTHWLLSRIAGGPLSGAAIERAIGENVAAWQPRGVPADRDAVVVDAALAWRRCVNEIQMLWFGHPVNEAREQRGVPTVNTLWLSGNGARAVPPPRYASVESGLPLLASIAIDAAATRGLESFDRFVEPARREDWSGWRDQLERLDTRLAAILREQAAGSIGTLTIVLCGRDRARIVELGPRDLAKKWRGWFGKRPDIAALLDEGNAA